MTLNTINGVDAKVHTSATAGVWLDGQFLLYEPVPGKFLGIVDQDPSDSKSSRLQVDIFRFCFIHLRYIP